MRQWMRSATLQIGHNRYSMEDLFFEFEVPYKDSTQLPTASFKIYNMAEATRKGIKKNDAVILNAGYEGDVGCVFVGAVDACQHQHSGTEWITTIHSTAALEAWLSTQINKTYTQKILASQIIPDLLNIFGIEVGIFEPVADRIYERGRVCKGKLKDVLTEIVCNDCKSRMIIRVGQLIINNSADGISMGYILTPSSGLLLSSNEIDETVIATPLNSQNSKTAKDEEGATKIRECLLNYHLGPGDQIIIESETLNGKFVVVKGKHTGSPTGQWKTVIEVKPAPPTPTVVSSDYKVGDQVILNGPVFADSYGNGQGRTFAGHRDTITIIAPDLKRARPYHIGAVGWVSADEITKA